MNVFNALNAALLLSSKLVTEVISQVTWINQSAFEYTDPVKTTAMSLTNSLRSIINPPPINLNAIEYNSSFEADVLRFLNDRPANWVFGNEAGYNNYFGNSPNPMNGYSLLDRPELSKWAHIVHFGFMIQMQHMQEL